MLRDTIEQARIGAGAGAPSKGARAAQPRALVAITVLLDVVAVAAGYVLAAQWKPPLPQHRHFLLATLAFWPLAFAFNGLYDHRRLSAGWRETRSLFNGVSHGMFLVVLAFFLTKESDLSRGWTVLAWPSAMVTVTGARFLLRKSVHALRNRDRLRAPVLIVGTNDEARSIARTLRRNRWIGYRPVGFVGVSNGDPSKEFRNAVLDGLPIIGWTRSIAEAVEASGVGAVMIASSAVPNDKLAQIYWALQDEEVDVRLSAGVLNIAASRMSVEPLDGLPVLSLRQIQLPRGQAILKRAFDIVVSSLLILLLAPLFAVVAVAITATSQGAPFFLQLRTGQGGRPFRMVKFRSMYADAEQRRQEVLQANEADGPLFKIKDDPRITPVGRFIRKWSIDELPQLFNVLVGDMSLVGPRPLPMEDSQHDQWLLARMLVKPGITGLWQVNGRHELTLDDFVRYELFYARNWSIALDLSILWRTIPAVLLRRGSW